MLNNVPNAINRMARNVVINHPNSFNCEVYRKKVTRASDGTALGAPTLGGLAVLDSMDEEKYEYQFLGYGYALPAEGFNPAPMMKASDANLGAADEFRFLIEPEEQSGHEQWFDVRSHDVVYLRLTAEASPPKLAYEIVSIETTSNIPPYTTRYIANRRNDLDLLDTADYESPDSTEG